MKYSKPALTFQQQTSLLIARGLIVRNPVELEDYLRQVNYYRLSGYWFNFKHNDPVTGSEAFKPGTTFEIIRERYEFDRRLRLLLMDAVERIEVAIFRTRMVEAHTTQYGPFGYTDYQNYNPKFTPGEFGKLLDDIAEDENRSHEEFIQRYRHKYIYEKYLPLWMVTELMSFGQLLTLYRNQHLSFKKTIAHQFKIYPQVLDSWMLTLNYIRNSCAHHARLWNRPIPLPIMLPDKKHDSRWYAPVPIPERAIFSVLTIIQYLLGFIVPTNSFKADLQHLLCVYPNIPQKPMGFPANWHSLPLWK